MMLSIGLMSGTSMDGIDAALLETDGATHIKELGHVSCAYQPQFKLLLKSAEYSIRNANGDMSLAKKNYPQSIKDYLVKELNYSPTDADLQILELAAYLALPITLDQVIKHSTELHAKAVTSLLEKTGYQPQQINVIGYHGQTMLHHPQRKVSIVVGDGQALANQLNIQVINDFRSQDIAAGGLGAPFAPLYHQALAIRDQKIPIAVVNCGGIANITVINNDNPLDLLAFDTGPGNGLIDQLVRQRTQGKEYMDADGHYGKQGKIHEDVLTALYEEAIIRNGENYFRCLPPKSLDIGDMKLISALNPLSIADACATLEAFTADTIVRSLDLFNIDIPNHWILAGGGWNNPVILRELNNRLKARLGNQLVMMTADEAGWNSQAMEAQIFAYFAVRSLQKKPLSVPGTTRVSQPMTGGFAYLPQT